MSTLAKVQLLTLLPCFVFGTALGAEKSAVTPKEVSQSEKTSRFGNLVGTSEVRSACDETARPLAGPTRPAERHSVGSALTPSAGIGVGVSVARTYDDAQYRQGVGRHVGHWWNGEYGENAEVSVHFSYRVDPDADTAAHNEMSGYNVFDATVSPDGDWPRGFEMGCELQENDTVGWGTMPSLDVTYNGRAVLTAGSHFYNGFLGDESRLMDNMVFYQGAEFSCGYGPGVNTTFIDSLTYRPYWLDQSEGIYSRNPQVVAQWDGSNTVVHLVMFENSEGVHLSGDDYCSYSHYRVLSYYRKVGGTASEGSWSAGQIIDSMWFPWVSLAAAPFPYENVVVTYTNASYHGALLDNCYDLDVWLRESPDRGLTWPSPENVTNYMNGIAGRPNHYTAWLETQALYTTDGDLHVVWTATPTSYDPCFDGFPWNTFTENVYHWVRSTGEIDLVVACADVECPWWGDCNTLVCGFGGSNAGFIANVNLSQCDNKLYCVWNEIHERARRFPWRDAPTQPAPGVLDDCAYEGNRLAIANWEIMMSVLTLDQYTLWDKPRNVSNTYTPNCGLPGDPEAEGPCGSDYKPSVEKYGFNEAGLDLYWPAEATVDLTPEGMPPYDGSWYLNLVYLDDQFPGPSDFGRTTEPRTYNSVKWVRLACVEGVYTSEIRVAPEQFEWPNWAELGQTTVLTVTVINDGSIALNVTEIGVDDNGGAWLSVSENPTPSEPFQVPAGTNNTATFDVILDATSMSSAQWLDGEIWLKSDAVNEDSTSISIHILATEAVEPVFWDTVKTHANMFDVYVDKEGECIALAVGNMGEIGWGTGTSGSVNLDYVESETECGPRTTDAIYLRSGSPFTILADDAAGTNAVLSQVYSDADQADGTGFDPVPDKGSMTGGLTASGEYDSVYTGKFVNRDTSIAMERVFYGPRPQTAHPEDEIIDFVVMHTKVYSADGQSHDHVTLGNVIDWDVPSEKRSINTSGVSTDNFLYVQGTDTTGYLSCQSHTWRFATEAFAGAYTSAELLSDSCANDPKAYDGAAALPQPLLEDTTHYRDGTPLEPPQPNPLVWWEETSQPGLTPDPTEMDQAVWLTYEHDYGLSADDTLHYWTVLTTVRDAWRGRLSELVEQVKYARCWYIENLRGCKCGCCEGRVGDAKGDGSDEPTISDISVMIDAKFISGTCEGKIPCLAEGDTNQSGGSDPTCNDVTISDISILIDYLFITGPDNAVLNDCL